MVEDKNKLCWDATGFGSLEILQDRKEFSYGVDAVLLADFASKYINAHNSCKSKSAINYGVSAIYDLSPIVDLGTGTGVIPLILSHKTAARHIYGFDVEPYFVDLAIKTSARNGLAERVKYLVGDVNDSKSLLESINFTRARYVLSNPPYFSVEDSLPSINPIKDVARREVKGKLDDFCKCASNILTDGGEFFMIHRPERLADILESLSINGLQPKDIRVVNGKMSQPPKQLLIRSVKGRSRGNSCLRWLPVLNVYEENGEYTEEIRKIYERL
ncbi:tRNA1(Val) (adenine(37)-N6)-methyltransferase [Eubacteriales bacterium KG127]